MSSHANRNHLTPYIYNDLEITGSRLRDLDGHFAFASYFTDVALRETEKSARENATYTRILILLLSNAQAEAKCWSTSMYKHGVIMLIDKAQGTSQSRQAACSRREDVQISFTESSQKRHSTQDHADTGLRKTVLPKLDIKVFQHFLKQCMQGI